MFILNILFWHFSWNLKSLISYYNDFILQMVLIFFIIAWP